MTTATATLTTQQADALAALPTDEMREVAMNILATAERKAAEITAANYNRRVVLRKGNLETIITIAPSDALVSWAITGVGIEWVGRGDGRTGDVVTRYRADLDDAKAYANGWVAHLQSQGYRITSKG